MRWRNWLASITARCSRVYGFETVSLRYFNVFGPRQDPGSQYSGVVSRFISALLSDEQPVIYGDGEQSRDFTYIDNVVAPTSVPPPPTKASGKVINVANGQRITLNQLLAELKDLTGKQDVTAEYLEPRVLAMYATVSPTLRWRVSCSATNRKSISAKDCSGRSTGGKRAASRATDDTIRV